MNYEFEAKNQQNQVINGTLDAVDEHEAEKILWQNQLSTLSIRPVQGSGLLDFIFKRVSVRDRAVFARQLATMLDAGFPILQALNVIYLQMQKGIMKDTTSQLLSDLEAGHSFSAALSKHPRVFSKVFIAVIQSGESSGKLPQVLTQLAEGLERDYSFSKNVRGAFMYPTFVLIVMTIIGVIMVVNVIPQLEDIFKEAGASLPWTTRAILWTTHFLTSYWYLVIIGIVGIILLIRAWGKTEGGRYQIDLAKLKIWGLKGVMETIYMTQFSFTFGLLTAAGLPILESIRITAATIGNVIYEAILKEAYSEVEKGVPLSVPLSKSSFFPTMVGQMVSVGEKTGKLDQIMNNLASYYEEESDRKIKSLSTLIEPILIVIIGIAVAIMVFAVIMPIYGLAEIT